jgi:hypothetical protein
MSLQSVEQLSFDFLPSLPIKIKISPAPLLSDAGLLPVRELDERIRVPNNSRRHWAMPATRSSPRRRYPGLFRLLQGFATSVTSFD